MPWPRPDGEWRSRQAIRAGDGYRPARHTGGALSPGFGRGARVRRRARFRTRRVAACRGIATRARVHGSASVRECARLRAEAVHSWILLGYRVHSAGAKVERGLQVTVTDPPARAGRASDDAARRAISTSRSGAREAVAGRHRGAGGRRARVTELLAPRGLGFRAEADVGLADVAGPESAAVRVLRAVPLADAEAGDC